MQTSEEVGKLFYKMLETTKCRPPPHSFGMQGIIDETGLLPVGQDSMLPDHQIKSRTSQLLLHCTVYQGESSKNQKCWKEH